MHTLHTVEEQISFVTVTVTQLHVELIPTICAKNCRQFEQNGSQADSASYCQLLPATAGCCQLLSAAAQLDPKLQRPSFNIQTLTI